MKNSEGQLRKRSVLIIAVYLVLLALIIPWYWSETEARVFFGFPLWVLSSLAALFLTSSFTAWLCLQFKANED